MIQFILNDKLIETSLPAGMTLVDFIRYESHLKGTKIGCREGDCGACTCLIGELRNGVLEYKSVTSCIYPLGNANGKHVVTIEGLNMENLSPVQFSLVENSGSQCGFCTPGFVVSLAGFCLSSSENTIENAISSMDGNICRCTGYKSIERAAKQITEFSKDKDTQNPIKWCISNGFVPEYFGNISERLLEIEPLVNIIGSKIVGGGTDLLVQQHDAILEKDLSLISYLLQNREIKIDENNCIIDASCTVSDLMHSRDFNEILDTQKFLKLISSTQIRNMGTIAGNFVNASPIGDLSVIFLALESSLLIKDKDENIREIKLKDFFISYKVFDLNENEIIEKIKFTIPDKTVYFNFEKVSKRTYLDIASVNSAIKIKIENNIIKDICASAGGVYATPLYLTKTCNYLIGKENNIYHIKQATEILNSEIRPITDIRGTEEYKRLLIKQLFFAHFVELFPETFKTNIS